MKVGDIVYFTPAYVLDVGVFRGTVKAIHRDRLAVIQENDDMIVLNKNELITEEDYRKLAYYLRILKDKEILDREVEDLRKEFNL